MKVKILAVGQKMPAWVDAGVQEYSKRLPKELGVQWYDIAASKRPKQYNVQQVKAQEAERIQRHIHSQDLLVALEVKGKAWSTEQLALHWQDWQQQGRDLCLLIGGPDGLAPELSAKAQWQWSLSALTLPHPLVRVILAEQLYRAWTLMAGHPYHK